MCFEVDSDGWLPSFVEFISGEVVFVVKILLSASLMMGYKMWVGNGFVPKLPWLSLSSHEMSSSYCSIYKFCKQSPPLQTSCIDAVQVHGSS